jgi:3',5'-cyclic AMP phosphodiesterase CpdA
MPYLNIHTLPTQGETGGVASGTEQYYSFDYGRVHVVSLDSQLAARDPSNRQAMLQWLRDDLAANSSDWTVVIFHHPPYTKGSHDSDKPLGGVDQPIFDMREQFTPVFDEYGVDLVYSGHSHIYERSYYIGGHTGLSDSFDPQTQAELNDSGQPASGQGDEAYSQITRNGTDDKAVYTVAGNGGKATSVSKSFPHPAHFYSNLVIGSVVVDAAESSLTARFIDDSGTVLDSFTINR